jgi:predicted nucleic acid-binding protein
VRFVDTNILLYAISRDRAEARKAAIANEIIDDGDISLSVQVLQEFYVQATRASRADAITHDQAVGLVEAWCRFPVQVISVEVMRAALATRTRFGISYWDASILEASRAAGCSVVLSEDLDDTTDYDGIHVENPFRNAGGPTPPRSAR